PPRPANGKYPPVANQGDGRVTPGAPAPEPFMTRLPVLALLALAVTAAAAGAADPDPKALAAQPRGVLKQYCYRCHGQELEAGAPDSPAAEPRRFLTPKDTLTALRDYLRSADPDRRPYLRFFSLTNLHDNPRFSDADLRLTRAGLAKALNSLHWRPATVTPVA